MPTGYYPRKHRYGYKPGDPTRRCYRCLEEKPIADYSPDGRRWDKYRSECKACSAKREREARIRNPEQSRARSRRYKAKDPEAYHARKRDRYEDNIEKQRERGRDYVRLNPRATKRTKLKHRYGITDADFDAMLEAQRNACAICGRSFRGTRACVDHCHSTGTVRGLLCIGCNGALGYIERPDFVTAATEYLERSKRLSAA